MPRGRPKKVQPVENQTFTSVNVEAISSFETHVAEVVASEPMPKKVLAVENPDQVYINESRKALNYPLPAGQKFFESPDGEIIVGEASKDQVWSRRMNKGHGGWVNPRR